jgi:hypothetical protein
MTKRLADAIGHLVCATHSWEWLFARAETDPLVNLNIILHDALPRANPSNAYCDVLRGEPLPTPPGGLRFGPETRPLYWQ